MIGTLEVYDPVQGCAAGACGPGTDDETAQFAQSIDWLRQAGVAVSRYNLGHEPGAFAKNALVKGILQKEGMACLPLVLGSGKIISKGRYPSRGELGAHLGLAVEAANTGSDSAN